MFYDRRALVDEFSYLEMIMETTNACYEHKLRRLELDGQRYEERTFSMYPEEGIDKFPLLEHATL